MDYKHASEKDCRHWQQRFLVQVQIRFVAVKTACWDIKTEMEPAGSEPLDRRLESVRAHGAQ